MAEKAEDEISNVVTDAKGIFANSRLAALYQRGKNKDDKDKSDDSDEDKSE